MDVKRRDLIQLVEDIRDGRRGNGKPAPAMAKRTLNVLTRLFNWALEVDNIQTSPAVRLRLPAPKGQRDKYLTDDEIRKFWRELEEVTMPDSVKLALHLILVTGQRRGEVAGAGWKEFDLKKSMWTLPHGNTKNGKVHVVPLSKKALDILGQVRKLAPDSRYLFPAKKGEGGMDPRLITRWCRKIQDQLDFEKFNSHDLRRTCATGLGALGVDRLTIGKILNHADSGVTGIYDVHEYFEQKKKALNKWARNLNRLINPDENKVISIGKLPVKTAHLKLVR
jgi:integrase